MKFKKGDKVIIINALPQFNGREAIIYEINGDHVEFKIEGYRGTRSGQLKHCVAPEVYNSPLFSALIECKKDVVENTDE